MSTKKQTGKQTQDKHSKADTKGKRAPKKEEQASGPQGMKMPRPW